jgi:uncharacterized protein with PCYCGC motif
MSLAGTLDEYERLQVVVKLMKILVAFLLALLVAIALVLWSSSQRPLPDNSVPVATESAATTPQPAAHDHAGLEDYAVKGRVPAYYTTEPAAATLPPTLAPEAFTGNKRLAYEVAKEIPQVLAQLPCYCHCDRGHGHKSLHSCFESEHGEGCGICINEALMAFSLHKQGKRVSEIRDQIIRAYGQS